MKIPESVRRHWVIIDEIQKQTDRSAAIIGAPYLEERLSEVIKSRLLVGIDNKSIKVGGEKYKINKRIFEGYGPLSSFNAKIVWHSHSASLVRRVTATFTLLEKFGIVSRTRSQPSREPSISRVGTLRSSAESSESGF